MCQEWKLNSGMRQMRFPESSISDVIFTKSSNGLWLAGFCKTIGSHPYVCLRLASRANPYSFEVVLGVAVPPKHYSVPHSYASPGRLPSPPGRPLTSPLLHFLQSSQSGSLKTRQIPLPFYSKVSKASYFLRIKAEFLRVKA